MRVLAIDPGNEISGVVVYDSSTSEILSSAILTNAAVLNAIRALEVDACVIEEFESFGMAVGKEVFRTVLWSGRFVECWTAARGSEAWLMPRRSVKIHHCGTSRGTDATVWQALVDRFGPPGVKAAPGMLFGIKSHLRSALALAVAFSDQREGREPKSEARRA